MTDVAATDLRPSRWRSHAGSLAKAVSWRMTAGIDTFIIGYIVTGSVKGAGSIAAMELFTKIALFWAHERAWLRLERATLPTLPFFRLRRALSGTD